MAITKDGKFVLTKSFAMRQALVDADASNKIATLNSADATVTRDLLLIANTSLSAFMDLSDMLPKTKMKSAILAHFTRMDKERVR